MMIIFHTMAMIIQLVIMKMILIRVSHLQHRDFI